MANNNKTTRPQESRVRLRSVSKTNNTNIDTHSSSFDVQWRLYQLLNNVQQKRASMLIYDVYLRLTQYFRHLYRHARLENEVIFQQVSIIVYV